MLPWEPSFFASSQSVSRYASIRDVVLHQLDWMGNEGPTKEKASLVRINVWCATALRLPTPAVPSFFSLAGVYSQPRMTPIWYFAGTTGLYVGVLL